VERKLLGFDHADVGGELLRAWKLPEPLAAATAFHHRPDLDTTAPLESATIHLADILAHALEAGTSGDRRVPALDSEAWDRLALPVRALAAIVEQTELQLRGAREVVPS
jgi:HD-like signal output (HDOD) protein